MKKLTFLLLLQFYVFAGIGQIKLSGIIYGNKEPLAGASVVLSNSMYGLSTFSDGSFEFKNLKPGDYEVKVSFIGYETNKTKVSLTSDKKISITLKPNVVMTDEILISASTATNKTPMAFNNLSGEEISKQNMGQDIPYLLQLTP
ncbi:MAG TPA: carboxypeptidase-like regulatory domain-containing protein, partial [Draconibacterium sp.]|nr:carboxypeptidase-like regulatory domain-containing protein [Draconibacterium sp.]